MSDNASTHGVAEPSVGTFAMGQVALITNTPPATIEYYIRNDYISPAGSGSGPGKKRQFGLKDALYILIIRLCLDVGIKAGVIVAALEKSLEGQDIEKLPLNKMLSVPLVSIHPLMELKNPGVQFKGLVLTIPVGTLTELLRRQAGWLRANPGASLPPWTDSNAELRLALDELLDEMPREAVGGAA